MAILTNPIERKILKFKVLRQLFRIMKEKTGSNLKAFSCLKDIKQKYKSTLGQKLMKKAIKVNGKYFWRLSAPSFPSKACYKMHENEIDRLINPSVKKGLRAIVFAITKKCTLNCKHCFEWNNLSDNDTLERSDLLNIVKKFQDIGTTQFMFTGGEPMLRSDDICYVVENAAETSEFWIITSGMGLTPERAEKLKNAGLTGVLVSIEHYDRDEHNRFRGSEHIFDSALNAIRNTNDAGMLSALSLCAHKDIATKEHMTAYMDFAKDLDVSFVQILDPRAAGRFKGKDVELPPDQLLVLENIYIKYNSERIYKDHPIVNYLGYHQRRTGCFGGGDRFFYIDTDGDAHLCPYCRGKIASAIDLSADEVISKLAEKHCYAFDAAEE